ncbi:MAG: hypothetical protein ABEK36_05285 [Candidatus Aenigmatarchaeota archaeon]
MKSKIISICLVFILLFSISCFSEEIVTENLKEKLVRSKLEENVKNNAQITKIKELENNEYDIEIEKYNSKIKLKKVKNYEKLKNITILDNIFGFPHTTGVSIDTEEKINTTIYLAKKGNYFINSVYHSDNGINYSRVKNINIAQNKTHVWFNVSSFSSWTASMDDIYIFHDFVDGDGLKKTADISLTDYSSITDGDCISVTLDDTYNESTLSRSNCNGDIIGFDIYTDEFDCYGERLYYFSLSDSTFSITPYSSCDTSYTDNYGGARFKIYDSSGTTLQDSSNQVDIVFGDYDSPSAQTFAATNIGDTSARLGGDASFNDVNNDWAYSYTCSGTCEEIRFRYREKGTSSWSYTSFQSVTSDGVNIYYTVSGLSPDTTYEYQTEFSYYSFESSTNGGGFTEVYGSTKEFTTTGGVNPTITTLSAIVGDKSAELRADADFDGYSGNMYVRFAFTNATDTYNTAWYSAVDGVPTTYTTLTESNGLENNVQYSYYAILSYNETADGIISTGDTVYFTPRQDTSQEILISDLIAFWDLSDLFDKINNYELINSGSDNSVYYPVYNISGSSSPNSSLFISANSDKMTYSEISSPTGNYSFSFWVNVSSLAGSGEINNYISISDKEDTSNTKEFSIYYDGNADEIIINLDRFSNENQLLYTGFVPELYKYYFFTVTVDYNNQMKFYVNGNLNATKSITGGIDDITSTRELAIGTYWHNGIYDQYADIIIDDILIFDKILENDYISYLYNYGFNVYENYDIETLSATNITYKDAVLRGYVINYSSLNGYSGGFRWRINGSTEWLENISADTTELFNNTVFDFDSSNELSAVNFESNTTYEYQAFIYNITTLDYVYSDNYSYFTTEEKPVPLFDTLNAINVMNDTATLRCEINNLYNWSFTAFDFYYANDSGIYTLWDTGEEYLEERIYSNNVSVFNPETNYYYFCNLQYGENDTNFFTINGTIKDFTTTETGAPTVNTLEAENIEREEAYIRGEIVDLGIYNNATYYFWYANSTNNYTTSKEYVEYNLSITQFIDGLIQNTTYDYELIVDYGDNRNVSGGVLNFTTKDIYYFLEPEFVGYIEDSDINYNSVITKINLEINDNFYNLSNPKLFYYIYDNDGALINSSGGQDIIDSGIYSYTFNNLDSNTNYIFASLLQYSYNGTDYIDYGNNVSFSTLDITNSPKNVSILGFYDYYVNDPFKFRFQLLYFIPIITLIFSIVGIKEFGNDSFIINIFIGFSFLIQLSLLLWLYFEEVLSVWNIIIISLYIPLLLFINRGGIYE